MVVPVISEELGRWLMLQATGVQRLAIEMWSRLWTQANSGQWIHSEPISTCGFHSLWYLAASLLPFYQFINTLLIDSLPCSWRTRNWSTLSSLFMSPYVIKDGWDRISDGLLDLVAPCLLLLLLLLLLLHASPPHFSFPLFPPFHLPWTSSETENTFPYKTATRKNPFENPS